MTLPATPGPARKTSPARYVVAVVNVCGIVWSVWHWGVPSLPDVDWWHLMKATAATLVCGPLFLALALFAFLIASAPRR